MQSSEKRVLLGSRRAALILSLVYWLSGAAWILFSDRFAASIARSPEQLTAVQNYKGWAYVTVTAGLLYWVTVALINRYGAVPSEW